MKPLSRIIPDRWLQVYLRWERWALGILLVLLVGSAGMLLWSFYRDSTVLQPGVGGTYIEGSVGQPQPLNPWFTVQNDVNRDIVSLVFSGLLRYNPQTKQIEDDLATFEVSRDGKIYTVTLKEGLLWHDSTDDLPRPVTAADIVFTYGVLQDPEFPSSLLRQNFQGVTIEQLNDRQVQFRLDEPYSFFPSNLTMGLLPRHLFEGVPIRLLDQTIDFGLHPVGAGPYKLKSVIETELSTEVTLERWPRPIEPSYHLERVVLRIFSDYQSLLSDLRNLDGIRLVPFTEQGEPAIPTRFVTDSYTLPQYVALFFNMDRPILSDQKLRLGLQLGTDKRSLTEAIGEARIIDTPLLQIDTSDWRYAFDKQAAQGALFESQWYFPEKVHLQRLLEQREANDTGLLRMDPVVLLDTGAVLTVSGDGSGLSDRYAVNGVPLSAHPTQSGSWKVALPTAGGTGSIKLGMNLIRLTNEDGQSIDSFYLRRTNDALTYRRALEEQRLVDRFLASREGNVTPEQRIDVSNLTVDQGYLRIRSETDPVGIRINDKGQSLRLTLLTSDSPAQYAEVANMLREQWASFGVDVEIVIPKTRAEFEERLLKRDYDVLLFGQSLLDNLDSYPYWHSSGVQKVTGNRADLRLDAYNLSQYASFEADSLLEIIRGNTGDAERTDALAKLQEVLKRDVPAIFLYSPLYTYAHRSDIQGIELGRLSLHSDRFLTLHRWFVQQDRVFKKDKSWLSFFSWLSSIFVSDTPVQDVFQGDASGSGTSIDEPPPSQ